MRNMHNFHKIHAKIVAYCLTRENFKIDRGKFKWDILSNFSNIALDSHTAKHHKLEQFNLCEFRREWRGSAVNFFPVFLWGRRGKLCSALLLALKVSVLWSPSWIYGVKSRPSSPRENKWATLQKYREYPFYNAPTLHIKQCWTSWMKCKVYSTTSSWIKTYFSLQERKTRFLSGCYHKTSC